MLSDPKISRFSPPKTLIVGTFFGLLALHVYLAFRNAGLLRDQHLGTALLYAKGSIDLLHPVIVGFNATGTSTPLEFPLWQALTAGVMKIFGTWWGWGNVVSWLLFATCVAPFYRLAERQLGLAAAGWATLALLLQPLIIVQAGQAGTDGTALAASIWLVCLIDRMTTDNSWRFCAIAAVVAAVSATQKLPFFMAAGIAGFGLTITSQPFSWRRWARLAIVGAIGSAAFFLWDAHCVREILRAEFPLQDLRASTPAMREWYFGSFGYRMDPMNWIRGGYRISTGVFGSFLLLPVVSWALCDQRQSLARWWLIGALITTLVFTHLVLHHWHYFLMTSPAFALLIGGGLAKMITLVPEQICTPRWMITGTIFLGLVLASIQGLQGSHFLMRDDYPRDEARIMAAYTSPKDKLVVGGGSWGGLELILSDRQGLTVEDTALLANRTTLERLRDLGYTKIVLLSQSPKNSAIALVGGSQERRRMWRALVRPGTPESVVIFENDDISIRLLPILRN